jgi:hypothetical protein
LGGGNRPAGPEKKNLRHERSKKRFPFIMNIPSKINL